MVGKKRILGGKEIMPIMCRNDYENGTQAVYLFNKKRLIKALNWLGVSDWKEFLKNEYTSDDTEQVIEEFELKGWKYKQLSTRNV